LQESNNWIFTFPVGGIALRADSLSFRLDCVTKHVLLNEVEIDLKKIQLLKQSSNWEILEKTSVASFDSFIETFNEFPSIFYMTIPVMIVPPGLPTYTRPKPCRNCRRTGIVNVGKTK
jgi:hypothetical protein